jgi:hypothetical protein
LTGSSDGIAANKKPFVFTKPVDYDLNKEIKTIYSGIKGVDTPYNEAGYHGVKKVYSEQELDATNRVLYSRDKAKIDKIFYNDALVPETTRQYYGSPIGMLRAIGDNYLDKGYTSYNQDRAPSSGNSGLNELLKESTPYSIYESMKIQSNGKTAYSNAGVKAYTFMKKNITTGELTFEPSPNDSKVHLIYKDAKTGKMTEYKIGGNDNVYGDKFADGTLCDADGNPISETQKPVHYVKTLVKIPAKEMEETSGSLNKFYTDQGFQSIIINETNANGLKQSKKYYQKEIYAPYNPTPDGALFNELMDKGQGIVGATKNTLYQAVEEGKKTKTASSKNQYKTPPLSMK